MLYKKIDIKELIINRIEEIGLTNEKLFDKIDTDKTDFDALFTEGSLSVELLLKISKLLEYDFFRVYSMHLLLYAPPNMSFNQNLKQKKKKSNSKLPKFKKNTYTPEMILFIVGKLKKGELTIDEAIKKYSLPKTTLYRWKNKYI